MAVERLIRKTVANSKLRKGQECCVKLYPASIINFGKINDFWVIYEDLVHLHLLSEGKFSQEFLPFKPQWYIHSH